MMHAEAFSMFWIARYGLADVLWLLYTLSAFPMLVLRLQRVGRENTPAFRIVVSEKALSAKTGAHEIIGHYLPAENPPVFECKTDRVEHWIKMGAKPSDTLARLLKKNGMDGMDKYIVKYAKKKSKSASEEEAAPAAEGDAPATDAAPEAEKPAAEEAPKEEKKEEAPTEEKKEEPTADEKPAEEAKKEELKEEEKKPEAEAKE